MIEEFMLLANMAVADFIAAAFPERAMLRRHPPPNERKLNETVELAAQMGYPLSTTTAGKAI